MSDKPVKDKPPRDKAARKRNKGRRSDHKLGVPAGSLVHVGEIKTDRPRISLIEYDASGMAEREFASITEARDFSPTRQTVWLNVHGLHDPAVMAEIGRRFELHPLTMEDILNTTQRAKVDEYPAYLFIVLRLLDVDREDGQLSSEQLGLVLGRNFVLSFQEQSRGIFTPIRERMRTDQSALRERGADHLAYSLLDVVVDRYFLAVDHLAEEAEALEEEAMTSPSPSLLARINRCKRDTLTVRRAVWPLRELVGTLQRSDRNSFTPETRLYLRDVQDHAIHVLESLDAVRDQLGDLLEIYMSSASNRLNVEVRILTVLSMLFMPATLIAGIWGMNFSDMPLTEGRRGFWWVILLMAGCALVMGLLFWRRRMLRREE